MSKFSKIQFVLLNLPKCANLGTHVKTHTVPTHTVPTQFSYFFRARKKRIKLEKRNKIETWGLSGLLTLMTLFLTLKIEKTHRLNIVTFSWLGNSVTKLRNVTKVSVTKMSEDSILRFSNIVSDIEIFSLVFLPSKLTKIACIT